MIQHTAPDLAALRETFERMDRGIRRIERNARFFSVPVAGVTVPLVTALLVTFGWVGWPPSSFAFALAWFGWGLLAWLVCSLLISRPRIDRFQKQELREPLAALATLAPTEQVEVLEPLLQRSTDATAAVVRPLLETAKEGPARAAILKDAQQWSLGKIGLVSVGVQGCLQLLFGLSGRPSLPWGNGVQVAFGVALLLLFGKSWLDRRQLRRRLIQRLRELSDAEREALVERLWAYDAESARGVLTPLLDRIERSPTEVAPALGPTARGSEPAPVDGERVTATGSERAGSSGAGVPGE